MTVTTITKTRLLLPMLPPSANRMHGHGKGRVYRSNLYRKWLRDMGYFIAQQAATAPSKPIYTHKVTVNARMKRPTETADIDNRIKPLGDLLQTYQVVQNDRLISKWNAEWADDIEDGFEFEIEIIPIAHFAGEGLG